MITNDSLQSPLTDLVVAVVITIAGGLLFVYREQIGAFTGYYTGKGGFVDKPTPGCLLIPFALVLVIGGALLIVRTLSVLW
jgi:hypothetical protein